MVSINNKKKNYGGTAIWNKRVFGCQQKNPTKLADKTLCTPLQMIVRQHLQHSISKLVAITLTNGLVSSSLDYWNSLLYHIWHNCLKLLGILVLQIILQFWLAFHKVSNWIQIMSSHLQKPNLWHHISVLSLFHFVISSGVSCRINLAFLLLVPSCGISLPLVTFKELFANYLNHNCLTLLFLQIHSSFIFSGWFDLLCWWTYYCALNTSNIDSAHYKSFRLE